jgi:hypothetical protein
MGVLEHKDMVAMTMVCVRPGVQMEVEDRQVWLQM